MNCIVPLPVTQFGECNRTTEPERRLIRYEETYREIYMVKCAGDGHVARIPVSTCPFAWVACSMHNTQYSEHAYPSSSDATRRDVLVVAFIVIAGRICIFRLL